MKLLMLTTENFMGLTGCHSLALDGLGLVHVAGCNEDDPGNNSNGAGKTTILEALTWGLFGEGLPRPQGNSEQGVRADEVLNDRLGKQCRVLVELADEEQRVAVQRWRKWKDSGKGKQSSGVSLITSGEQTEALDEKETNRLICQALGITHDIWCRGVIFGQESGFNFCDATAKSRQDILTTVMGLEEIDTWHERCRDEKRALTNKLATIDGRLDQLRIEDRRLAAEEPAKRSMEWEADRRVRLNNARAHVGEITDHGKALKDQLDAIVVPFVSQAREWPKIVAAEDTVARAQQAHAQQCAELTRCDGRRKDILQEKVALARLSAESTCPTCRQVISDEHQAACMAEIDARAAQAEQEHAKAAEAAKACYSRVQAAQQALGALQAERQEHEHRRELERQSYDAVIRQRGRLESQVVAARVNWTHASNQVTLIEGECDPNMAWRADMEGRIERVAAELAEAEAEQGRIATALDTALWWDKELPRFKTWMFDSVVDVLAGEANRWLGVMSGGVIWIQISTTKQVGKRLKDELDVQIYRWNPDGSITSRPYRIWSGGEKRRVALAVDLGLSRLMAQRASKAYRFLALDEVDRHLDDRGKDGLRAVLDELRRDKDTVITVTHDAEFRASFDTEIKVIKRNGRTEIREHGRREAGS